MSNSQDALKALFKDAMDWGRSYGQRLNLSDITVDDVSDQFAEKALAAIAKQQASPEAPDWRKEVGKMARALDQAQRHAEDSSHPATMREVSSRLNALLTTSAPQCEQAAGAAKLSKEEVHQIICAAPVGLSHMQTDEYLVRAAFDVGFSAALSQGTSQAAATGGVQISDERIVEMWSRMPKHHSIVEFARAILAEAGIKEKT